MLFNNTNMRTAMAYTNAVGDKVYPIIVDIKKGIKSTEEVSFVSSDINTGVLSVAFIQGNDTYNVEGAEVICSIMRPDTTTLEIPCNIINGNTIEVPLGVNGTSQDGVYSFDFKVFKGGNKVVGTPIMNYSVSLSISNDLVIEEDDRLPVLTMLITQVNELKEETRETINQANVATEASKEATANAIEATNNANAVSERVSQETSEAISRVDNTIVELNNTVSEKVSELDNAKSDMTTTVSNKVNEVENRFNALTSSQQQSSEVIDARDGEVSLKARLDRDIEKAKQVYVNVEGSHISTDSSVGYLKDVEILGNTIQDTSNLADIRSVGDKVEGQELYEIPVLCSGKNIFDLDAIVQAFPNKITRIDNGIRCSHAVYDIGAFINFNPSKQYKLSWTEKSIENLAGFEFIYTDGTSDYIVASGNQCLSSLPNKQIKTIRITYNNSGYSELTNIQLEEGAVATPYEPYQEDKLTILSPVQLEKVGDVRDRIIEKDGVWSVEKNVKSITFSGEENWTKAVNKNTSLPPEYRLTNAISDYKLFDTSTKAKGISNKYSFIGNENNCWISTKEGFGLGSSVNKGVLYVCCNVATLDEFKTHINKFSVKYIVENPQFIPLPHDQQVKLRTFANKTNISFLTEIEGTIKAQVPKSLGATVNTHTEQISNLNKELDRVKKLEESTVSTVTTESDFTVVEQTSNGYFEDVKLEGKTLVNLFNNSTVTLQESQNRLQCTNDENRKLYKKGVYTIINLCDKTVTPNIYTVDNPKTWIRAFNVPGNSAVAINLEENQSICEVVWFYSFGWTSSDLDKVKNGLIILEGDHTQNPPSGYIEGLKSVGQDVDEIVVSSVSENLIPTPTYNLDIPVGTSTNNYSNTIICKNIPIKPNTTYRVSFGEYINKGNINGYPLRCMTFRDKYDGEDVHVTAYTHKNRIKEHAEQVFTTEAGAKYLVITVGSFISVGNIEITELCLTESSVEKPYTPRQSDKKQILFYNNETQSWEKPILREWDSIEKHSDGKYYYHQRSGEVVLNGSESWNSDSNSSTISPPTYRQSIRFNSINIPNSTFDTNISSNLISDLLPSVRFSNTFNNNHIGISIYGTGNIGTHIVINNGFENATELKQWLQTNNITVVYQLAEEKVYECTNIDLITYANETNYIVESGTIAPRTTLKVHNNISNVVSLLQKKVSLLENNVKASQEVQDMMILETDMRMLDIELALMEFAPMKLNLGGSDMLRSATYFNFLKNHIINETYEKGYLENVMNKYLATGRINQDEYDELYKMLYPPVYDIELPIEL